MLSFLIDSFRKLAEDLSDHTIMTRQEAYYRVKLSRMTGTGVVVAKTEAPAPKSEKQTVKFAEVKAEAKTATAAKVCSGHLEKQLSAVRKDGRPYVCGFGTDCTFVHMSIAGMTNQKLMDVAAGMPSPMRQDITKAVQARK